MPDPTLAEVLAALERRKSAPPGQTIEALSFADLAGQYFDANRTALEQWEWRCAVVAAVDPPGDTLTGVQLLTDSENVVLSDVVPHWSRTSDGVVMVGANWKPEVHP